MKLTSWQFEWLSDRALRVHDQKLTFLLNKTYAVVLKRTFSMRRFFWATKTNTNGWENIYSLR